MVLAYFISVLVLCVMQILHIGCNWMSRHVSLLNNVLFALSHCLSSLFFDFSCLPPGFASNYCWSQVLNADYFFFLGRDNIISFVLCSIFGCAVLPWWTDSPMPAVIFSACHKCSFCILWRVGTLWSFDSAQQGGEGQPAEAPEVHRQLKERLWKTDLWFSPNRMTCFIPPACTMWSSYP